MSPVNPRRTARRGAKVAAVVAVTGAFVASIASAATAAPDLRTIAETTISTITGESGSPIETTIITSTTETSTTSETSTSTETSTTSETSAPAPSGDEVYADLYVELDAPTADKGTGPHAGPMVFSATNRLVGDGPELTGADLTSNPSDYCGDISVDVSLDPATVTITGGTEYCDFGSAYLRIMLHGATFGAVTLTGDDLFGDVFYEEEPPGDGPVDQASGVSGSGAFGASLPIMTAIVDRPTLQSYGAAGPLFTASWEGLMWANMDGTATFNWVVGAAAPTVSDANPVFTG